METIDFGPFLGINTRRNAFSLRTKEGQYLLSADNVDIDNAGTIRRRRGVTLAQSMTNPHSLHIATTSSAFLVRNSVLYAVTLPSYSETLVKILSSDARMNFVSIGSDWYYSNGTDSGRVLAGTRYPMALATPAKPTLTSLGGADGSKQVAISYVNASTGEEGGISAASLLQNAGDIQVSLPGAVDGATHINVYVSEVNGSVPKLHSTVAVGTSLVDVSTPGTGKQSSMRFEAPLPAGTLFYSDGRLCSIAGNFVYIGIPFRPGYYLPSEGYIEFPSAVSIAIGNQGGTYIAADKTYFIPGDLGNVQDKIREVLPYGAVPGTTFHTPDKAIVGWFGHMGFVLADTSGGVSAPMADKVDVTPPDIGTASICECVGYTRVSSCGYTMNLDTKAVTTYSGHDFTSVSRCYATKATGLYKTDTDDAMSASIGFGKHDFGIDKRKSMPCIYIGVDSPNVMNMQIKAPGMDYTYPARASSTEMQIQRIDPGKGLKSNWFDLTLTNTSGADFTLSKISFGAKPIARRIEK